MSLHPYALFLADAAGIDFLNSAALVSEAQIAHATQGALPSELDLVADQARNLREWFRGFLKERMGMPLSAGALNDLAPLSCLLARDEAYHRIERQEGRLTLGLEHRWRSPEALLIPIGETTARVIVEEDFTYVKACEGQDCTLMFADHTCGHTRRWCSMSLCGNRAKAAACRSRRRLLGP